jgi:hypothetical protein
VKEKESMEIKLVKLYLTRRTILFCSLLVAGLLLVSCSNGNSGQSGTVITEQANVESVTLIAIGQTPVKIHASVKGNYPNGCTLIYDIQQGWEEEVYKIRIMTKRPVDDSECKPGPIPFEDLYEIPVFQLQAGDYLVDINGVQEPLRFVFDNVVPTQVPE